MTKPKLLSLNTKHNRKVRIRDIVFHLGVVHLLLTQVGLLIIVENKLFLSDPTLNTKFDIFYLCILFYSIFIKIAILWLLSYLGNIQIDIGQAHAETYCV